MLASLAIPSLDRSYSNCRVPSLLRYGERHLLKLTPKDPHENPPQSFSPFPFSTNFNLSKTISFMID
jgi:hypothetical protein